MYLKNINILGYKNIKESSLQLSPGINCFIGSNGEGKTNFLDAGLWDEIRVETSLSTDVENVVTAGTAAPKLPHNIRLVSHEAYDGNVINIYERQ